MPKPILLVEDNVYDQELARVALARADLLNETAFVSDGAEALDYLFRHGEYASRPLTNPSLVILDLKMPKVDGIEVLRAIRANPDTAQIPVVMLTGSKEEQDVAESYGLGVNAFVVKPIKFKDLIQAVAEIGTFWALRNEPPPRSIRYVPPLEE
jgi:CheY-like chemotaxis protein